MDDHGIIGAAVRTLPDNTLLVILSDTHIGGSPSQEIFDSPQELTAFFEELAAHDGLVELVLAGDLFDFLRIGDMPAGKNRVALTIERPEYRSLFGAWRRFAENEKHRVVYLPGNHDAEMWWNDTIQTTLRDEGLVHEFAPSYVACFASAANEIIYCEHGNQFDPTNSFSNYNDPLDTPLGDHVVTDVLRRIVPHGRLTTYLDLRELNNVFPIGMIPEWLAGRLFYDLFDRAIKYLIVPIVAAYLIFRGVGFVIATPQPTAEGVQRLFIEVGYDALLLVVAFSLFFVAVRRVITRLAVSIGDSLPDQTGKLPPHAPQQIKTLLSTHHAPPMNDSLTGQQISVFISGHTHAPSLDTVERTDGTTALVINSGCWLRQLHTVPGYAHGPPVFVARHVLTHVRVFCSDSGVCAELWQHPKPTTQRLPWLERLAILGRRPAQPSVDAKPMLARAGKLSSYRAGQTR